MLAFEEPSAQLCVVALLSLCNNTLLPSTPPSLGTCPGGRQQGWVSGCCGHACFHCISHGAKSCWHVSGSGAELGLSLLLMLGEARIPGQTGGNKKGHQSPF